MATIADVARRAGVSIATVSRVLSPAAGRAPYPVSPETARRVRAAAAALDFVPSALAGALASRRSGLLGLLVPDLADPHYPQVARGAEDAARAAGLALLVCNTLGDSARLAEYLRLLRGRRVEAVLVSGGGSLPPSDVDTLARSGLLAVFIGRVAGVSSEPGLPYVAVDNLAAAAEATRHLLDAGYRRLLHLAGPASQTTMADRAAGFAAAAGAAGRRPEVLETDGSAEDGYRVAARLFAGARADLPDAIFAATDRLAIAVLAAATDAGLRVPADVALVGFDDLPPAALLRPALTSVAQPAQQLGGTAVRLALALAHGESAEPVTLPARLVVRDSSVPGVHVPITHAGAAGGTLG